MAGMNIPVNVYDEKGTVLYRAVPYTVGPDGDLLAATFTGECGPSVACAASCASSMSRITAKSGRVHGVFGHAAHGKSAANTGEHATQSGLTEESLTPVVALAKLFPPKPLFPQQQPGQPQEGLQENTMTSDCWGQETEGEPTWMKVAAVDHTSRLDCVHLQDHLERRCRQEHARPLGVVCSTREGIYTEGLREVIRQVTVLCPERGLLLAELAAEMQQTTDTYDILFDSASQYAVRKAIERDMRSFLFSEKEQMESEVRRLENRVNELRAKHNGMVKRFEEQKQTEQKMHEEEMRYLKRVNQQLINEIKRVTALEKASTTT